MILTSRFENGRLVYVENAEYKDYCNKNSNYKGSVWAIPHKTTQERTLDQNSALHKYFELLANELNAGGFYHKYFLGDKIIELDWTPELIKENIWRPIQVALLKKKSTTELKKVAEIDIVYEHLNRFFSNKPFFLHVPFPHDPNKVR